MNETTIGEANIPAPALPEPELTRADRCDRCGAQAFYRYTFAAGKLLFCQHHQTKHNDALSSTPVESQVSFRRDVD